MFIRMYAYQCVANFADSTKVFEFKDFLLTQKFSISIM